MLNRGYCPGAGCVRGTIGWVDGGAKGWIAGWEVDSAVVGPGVVVSKDGGTAAGIVAGINFSGRSS